MTEEEICQFVPQLDPRELTDWLEKLSDVAYCAAVSDVLWYSIQSIIGNKHYKPTDEFLIERHLSKWIELHSENGEELFSKVNNPPENRDASLKWADQEAAKLHLERLLDTDLPLGPQARRFTKRLLNREALVRKPGRARPGNPHRDFEIVALIQHFTECGDDRTAKLTATGNVDKRDNTACGLVARALTLAGWYTTYDQAEQIWKRDKAHLRSP